MYFSMYNEPNEYMDADAELPKSILGKHKAHDCANTAPPTKKKRIIIAQLHATLFQT